MSQRTSQGFTIAEVLVAVIMLTVGVMALVSSSAMVSRMVGRGRNDTMAGQVATAQIERLRQIAAATTPPCTHGLWRTDSTTAGSSGQIRVRWQIMEAAGNARDVRMTMSYPVGRRMAADTIFTTILCK